ncbi:MAG: 3-deoxy-manno-octulosonate cytidylyltransferase [bacterium]|nr:3-deoxy-manno-octulosonate cytidylyltransferase [bacterium]
MKIVAIIPARMESSRFPGKPLVDILGKTMVEHVWLRTKMSKLLDEVWVATPNKEIFDVVEKFGGKAIMTRPDHTMAMDRLAEANETILADLVVNVQGDEPLIYPEMIDAITKPLAEDDSYACGTLVQKITDLSEVEDRNRVKVVRDGKGDALFYSREPIPSKAKTKEPISHYKMVCVYPIRRESLRDFTNWGMAPLETIESIDLLRFLEHGAKVKVVETEQETFNVDTEADLIRVREIMRNDPLFKTYQ